MTPLPFIRRLFGPRFERPVFAAGAPPRVLMYCASNIGLGHMGRIVRVARSLRRLRPEANLLLATDAGDLRLAALAGDLAVAKLPGYAYRADRPFADEPRGLAMSKGQLRLIRQNMLLALAQSFQPDLVYMDTLPHGKRDEMLPVLLWQRKRRPRGQAALCMRDIPAGPDERFKFAASAASALKQAARYDRIFIAGDARFFDCFEEYGWPPALRERIEYLGFVAPKPPPSPDWDASPLARVFAGARQTIVAGFGGGWESSELSRALLDSLAAVRQKAGAAVGLAIFTGPSISSAEFQALERIARGDPLAHLETLSGLFSLALDRASLAILQAGSSAFQILDSDIPMLLYTREHKLQEQEIRAARLARFAGVERIEREEFLSPARLSERVAQALRAPRARRETGFSFDGDRAAAERLAEMLKSNRPETGA